MLDRIHHNGRLVQSVARKHLGVEVGFDRAAVEWLDGYVTRQHDHGDPDNVKGLVSALGSFLGECIVQTYGGEWFEEAHDWGVRLEEQNAVFPFAKVEKHLRNGPEDSVLSLFDMIPVLFRRGG